MIKQTLKEKLSRAPIAPSYEFHEAVEDALSRLPSKKTRSFYHRTGTLAATICAVMVIGAIPLAHRALSPMRPIAPNTFAQPDPTTSVGPGVVVNPGETVRLAGQRSMPADESGPLAVALSASHMEPGDAMRSITLVAPARKSDFQEERLFFNKQFPGMRIGGRETSSVNDKMNLALMGVTWDEESSRLRIGSLLYGGDLFRDLVRDCEMLDGLWMKDVYIDGESLNTAYVVDISNPDVPLDAGIHTEAVFQTDSSTSYIHSIPMRRELVKDNFLLIQIEFEHDALNFQHTFEIKANLVSKEIILPGNPDWDNPEAPLPTSITITNEPQNNLPDAAFPMPQANIDGGSVVQMPQPAIDPKAAVPMPTAPVNAPRYTPMPTPISNETTIVVTEAPWAFESPDADAPPTPIPTPTAEALPPEDPGE